MPGIKAVLLAEDIPGHNDVGAVKKDEILLADREVSFTAIPSRWWWAKPRPRAGPRRKKWWWNTSHSGGAYVASKRFGKRVFITSRISCDAAKWSGVGQGVR